MDQNFSYVQELILAKLLKTKDGLRYSQTAPDDKKIDNDLHNYHLQFLVKRGFIEKTGNLYRLTLTGKRSIAHWNSLGKPQDLFHVSILDYLVRTTGGKKQILLQKRTRQPCIGDIGVPAGKIHPGEKAEKAAKRKLKEETGLIADFKPIGVFRTIRRNKKGHLVQDTFYHICYADKFTGDLITENEFGENFWASFTQAMKFQRQNITASDCHDKMYRRIKAGNLNPFFFQEEIVLKNF